MTKLFPLIVFVLYALGLSAQKVQPKKTITPEDSTIKAIDHFTVVFKARCGSKRNIAVLSTAALSSKRTCIEHIIPEQVAKKLSPTLFEDFPAFNSIGTFTLLSTDIESSLKLISREEHLSVISVSKEFNIAVIKCSVKFLLQFIASEKILFADIFVTPFQDAMISGYDRSLNRINLTDKIYPFANGAGTTIGIRENNIDTNDIDLTRRTVPSTLNATTTDFHATSMATLAGGAGNSFYTGKGPAWQTKFFSSSFNSLFPDPTLVLMQKDVSVQNHSYGTIIQSFYGAEAVAYDQQLQQNPSLLHIFSSGNKGIEGSSTGIYAGVPGYANITGNFKAAKNVVTAAAIDTSGSIAPFSSGGPLYDGRLAPQITALGPNGTSDAAAIVTGAAAVLQQVYKDSNNQELPDASLIKSILFCTARDIGNTGIDYRSGFGLLDIYSAVNSLLKRQFYNGQVTDGSVWSTTFQMPANTARFKILLNWTDSTSQVNNNRALINDLDLQLVHLTTGNTYLPWTLNSYPLADSLNKPATRNRDSLNTSEMISVDLPAAGSYEIRVKGNVLTALPQHFSIAYTYDTVNSFRFTNPVHEGDLASDEDIFTIRWETSIPDITVTGDLSLTVNNGASWQSLDPAVQLARRAFNWSVPNISVVGQLRMTIAAGVFYSEKFYMGELPRLMVNYLCEDSVRISWLKAPLATSYKVFALKGSPYLELFSGTTDTFIVINRSADPYNVFAVQPEVSAVVAPRSIAIDIRTQGVKCYYNTLLGEASGEKIQLTLSMNFTVDADSVTFQKISANGALIRNLNTQPTSQTVLNYLAEDNMPVNGANYYRAIIWVNGNPVYTEIIYVLHNGELDIIVYPTPVRRGQSLNFQIRPAAGEGTLQILEATGRILTSVPANGSITIQTGTLPAGLYYYRFIKLSSKPITGKFIIK